MGMHEAMAGHRLKVPLNTPRFQEQCLGRSLAAALPYPSQLVDSFDLRCDVAKLMLEPRITLDLGMDLDALEQVDSVASGDDNHSDASRLVPPLSEGPLNLPRPHVSRRGTSSGLLPSAGGRWSRTSSLRSPGRGSPRPQSPMTRPSARDQSARLGRSLQASGRRASQSSVFKDTARHFQLAARIARLRETREAEELRSSWEAAHSGHAEVWLLARAGEVGFSSWGGRVNRAPQNWAGASGKALS